MTQVQATPEVPVQPGDGLAGGNGAPVTSAAGMASGGEEMLHVPVSAFRGLKSVGPRDFGGIIALAKQAEKYRNDGWDGFIEAATDKRHSGYGLRTAMEKNNWSFDPPPAAEPPAAEQPAAGRQSLQPYYDPNSGMYIDPYTGSYLAQQGADPNAQFQQSLQQMQESFDTKLDGLKEEWRSERQTEQQQAGAQRKWAERDAAEQAAISRALKAAGIERKAAEADFYGQKEEYDPEYDYRHVPSLRARAMVLWDRDIHPDDQATRKEFTDGLPIPAQYIERAAADYGATQAVQDLSTAARVADRHKQQGLPETALPAGPGGQAQPTGPPQTREQAIAQAMSSDPKLAGMFPGD